MSRFELNDLSQWQQVSAGVLIPIEVDDTEARRVEFIVFADQYVSVRFVRDGEYWPLAVGDGMMNVAYTQSGPGAVVIEGPADTLIRVRFRDQSQKVPAADEPSFTSIEPQETGENFEVRRAMHIMRLNQQRMERELRAEVQRLHAKALGDVQLANPTVEQQQAAKAASEGNTDEPAPAPKPAPASEKDAADAK